MQDTPDGYSKHKDDVEPQVSSSLPPPTIVEPVLNMKDPSQMTSTCHNSSIDLTETVKALKKEHAILAQRLQQQRQDLTVLQQTLTIRSTNQEEKLNILIAKWRNVARDAADDLFESASARVKEMGGLESWHNNTSRAYLKDWTDPNENNRSSSERHTDDENDREYLQEVADVEAQSAKLNHQVVSINQEVSKTVSHFFVAVADRPVSTSSPWK